MRYLNDLNIYWEKIENFLVKIVNKWAPVKEIQLSNKDKFKSVNLELKRLINKKDIAYKKWRRTNEKIDYNKFSILQEQCKKENNDKMIIFFQNRDFRDFLNNGLFWRFYSVFTLVKTNNKTKQIFDNITNGIETATNNQQASELFGVSFTNIKSIQDTSLDDCFLFSKKLFDNLKLIEKNKETSFKFRKVLFIEVESIINELPNAASSGDSPLPTKLLKIMFNQCQKIAFAIVNLFNECITTCTMPDQFKIALITPLYKNAGYHNVDNYRGISVLPPIEKAFEKLIAKQILDYFILFN